MILWLKAFHLISIITWFAGLFYLPRLYVYHSSCEDQAGRDRFKIMEYKLYHYITTPSAVLSVALGIWILGLYGFEVIYQWTWLQLKLILVAIIIWFHWYCGRLLTVFAEDKNTRPERFYRMINEIPTIPMILIVILAVVKPI